MRIFVRRNLIIQMLVYDRRVGRMESIHEQFVDTVPLRREFGKERNQNSLTESYKRIIADFERTMPTNINIVNVASEYGIQHRRVYDLFNLLSSLGICRTIERGKLSWVGISAISTAIERTYSKIECDSLTKPFSTLFNLGKSPSLGEIATHFIAMYMFFDVETLLLRQVSSVFHDPRSDIKSLERRMYLVLNFLEILGIVAHTMKTNEYKLIYDVTIPKRNALLQKQKLLAMTSPYSIESLLNKLDGPFTKDTKMERLKDFPCVRC